MTKTKHKPAGFSLIELLFAMVFLSVIIFGVIKLQTSNLTLSNTKKLELKAHSYAAQGLEIADALGADKIIDDCSTDFCCLKKNGQYTIKENDSEPLENIFERSFTHDQDKLTGGATLVTMTVAWEDSSGKHTVSAKRIILP